MRTSHHVFWVRKTTDPTFLQVIGADGVHSAMRRLILGESHPAARPQYSGTCAYRAMSPMDKAIESVGEEFATNSQILMGPVGDRSSSTPIQRKVVANVR